MVFHLSPSQIRYTQDSISNTFGGHGAYANRLIGESLDNLLTGKCTVYVIPTISVVQINGQWYSSDNRRLWVFKKAEELGECKQIPVNEIYHFPDHKFTTNSDGLSIHVRRNPGGSIWRRWGSKSKIRSKPRTNSSLGGSISNRIPDQLNEDANRKKMVGLPEARNASYYKNTSPTSYNQPQTKTNQFSGNVSPPKSVLGEIRSNRILDQLNKDSNPKKIERLPEARTASYYTNRSYTSPTSYNQPQTRTNQYSGNVSPSRPLLGDIRPNRIPYKLNEDSNPKKIERLPDARNASYYTNRSFTSPTSYNQPETRTNQYSGNVTPPKPVLGEIRSNRIPYKLNEDEERNASYYMNRNYTSPTSYNQPQTRTNNYSGNVNRSGNTHKNNDRQLDDGCCVIL